MNAHIYARSIEVLCSVCERARIAEKELTANAVIPVIYLNRSLRAAGQVTFPNRCVDCGRVG